MIYLLKKVFTIYIVVNCQNLIIKKFFLAYILDLIIEYRRVNFINITQKFCKTYIKLLLYHMFIIIINKK